MGAGDKPNDCCVSVDIKAPTTDLERKSPSFALLWFVYLFSFVAVSCLLYRSVLPPCKTQESHLQAEIDILQSRVSLMEKVMVSRLTKAIQNTKEVDLPDKTTSTNETKTLKRAKRAAKLRRYATRGPISCHLEGIRGPNIISDLAHPMQMPRHEHECILWRDPDLQPPVTCRMTTKLDRGENGVQFIKIDRSGFYYVYSQLTYRSNFLQPPGHRVEMLSPGSQPKTILQVLAPYRASDTDGEQSRYPDIPPPEESRYTGGVFWLQKGDLLAVYPIRGRETFVMNGDRSFFGVFLLK